MTLCPFSRFAHCHRHWNFEKNEFSPYMTDDFYRKQLKIMWKSKGPPLLGRVVSDTQKSNGGTLWFSIDFLALLMNIVGKINQNKLFGNLQILQKKIIEIKIFWKCSFAVFHRWFSSKMKQNRRKIKGSPLAGGHRFPDMQGHIKPIETAATPGTDAWARIVSLLKADHSGPFGRSGRIIVC